MKIAKEKILYVFGGEKAQGAEIVIERLMTYNQDHVDAHLILSPGAFADKLIAQGTTFHLTRLDQLKKLNRTDTRKMAFYLKALKNYFSISYSVLKYLKKHQIKIIHANTIVPAAYLIPLVVYCRLFHSSWKWYWSDHDLKYFSKIDSANAKTCMNLYDYTLVVSEAVKRKYPLVDKVKVLYNGLSPEVFRPDDESRKILRSKFSIAGDMILIGLAASINPDKRQLELINVFNKLSAQFSHIRLIIAGSYAVATPEYSLEVKNAIALNSNVIYAGFMDTMPDFYNGCDIIISNSNTYRSESLGTTIYEAMACGKIVIASDTGGTPEIIIDKVDGFLFEPENEAALLDKLSFVILNYDTMEPMQKAAREKVIKKFNIETMATEYNRLISDNNI